jgi:Major Facilitator Superfamily
MARVPYPATGSSILSLVPLPSLDLAKMRPPHPLRELSAYRKPQSRPTGTFPANVGAAPAPVEGFEHVRQVLLADAVSFVFDSQGVAAHTQGHDPARLGILHGDVEHGQEDLFEPFSVGQDAAILAPYAQLQTCGERERLDTLGRPRRLEQPYRPVMIQIGPKGVGSGSQSHPARRRTRTPAPSTVRSLPMSNANRFVYVAAAIAAINGALFGYETGIISGALLYIKRDFALSPFLQGLVVSGVLVGAVLGAAVGGRLADRLGRRRLILITAFVFLVGAVGLWSKRSGEKGDS